MLTNERGETINMMCDFCGNPAVVHEFRTLYADTPYENTGKYFLCEHCRSLPNDRLGLE